MPCMCWYDPPEQSKKLVKSLCQLLVDEIKSLESAGDPIGISLEDIKELLTHLYDPSKCEEKREHGFTYMGSKENVQFFPLKAVAAYDEKGNVILCKCGNKAKYGVIALGASVHFCSECAPK